MCVCRLLLLVLMFISTSCSFCCVVCSLLLRSQLTHHTHTMSISFNLPRLTSRNWQPDIHTRLTLWLASCEEIRMDPRFSSVIFMWTINCNTGCRYPHIKNIQTTSRLPSLFTPPSSVAALNNYKSWTLFFIFTILPVSPLKTGRTQDL